jgi:hypothetical protein
MDGVAVMAAQANSRHQPVACNFRDLLKPPRQGRAWILRRRRVGCVKVFAAPSGGRAYKPLNENIRDKRATHKLSTEIAKVKTGACGRRAHRARPKTRDGNVKAKAGSKSRYP